MKIVFMGTPAAAAMSLERLIDDGHEIAAVYTQPDRPSGRGNKVVFSAVKELALSNDLPVFQPLKIKTPDALEEFKSQNADIAVVVAYGRILPETFLSSYPKGAVNVHFSLLPKYRGAAPVNWAIVNGETETGVTIMQMDAGLDTGAVLLQKKTTIGADETAVELMNRLAELGANALSETLRKLDEIVPVPQDDSLASFAPIMKKEDGLIDWSMSAKQIANRVRGFQPFPTAFTFHKNARLTIWQAKPLLGEFAESSAGEIIEAKGDRLIVACGHGSALEIEELQPEGKRRMPARDYINGVKPSVGENLGRE